MSRQQGVTKEGVLSVHYSVWLFLFLCLLGCSDFQMVIMDGKEWKFAVLFLCSCLVAFTAKKHNKLENIL